MKYRTGEVGDWHALAEIIEERKPDSSCYSNIPMAESEVRGLWLGLLTDKDTTTLVLEDDGRAVGFLAMTKAPLYFSREPCAFDSLFAVRVGYEGHGVGLLRTYLADAKQKGVKRIEMTVANGLKGNDRVYRFLERIGMSEIGRVFHMEL